jgi:hypothetical protein
MNNIYYITTILKEKYLKEYQHIFGNSMWCEASLTFNEELKP